MAKRIDPVIIGVDTSKANLDIHVYGQSVITRIDNNPKAIKGYLKQLPPLVYVGIEATNTFHMEFVEQAAKAGIRIYIIDGYRLSNYRNGVGKRAKTDAHDAQLLSRYIYKEHDQLRPYTPLSKDQRALWTLLKRRAKVVQTTAQLRQALAEIKEVKTSIQATLRQLDKLCRVIEKRMQQPIEKLGWRDQVRRLEGIFGIGRLSAIAMVATFHRGDFQDSDAFVAFIGLDVRVRDSGNYKGKRKLTKKGESECRRLLFNAARAAVRGEAMKPYYERLLKRGLSKIAAAVAVSRKLARICFAMLRNGTEYCPNLG